MLTPPPKAQTDRLFALFDLDGSGKLDRDEFTLLAALLCESLAIRIATQSVISLVLAPMLAAHLAAALGAIPLGTHRTLSEGLYAALPEVLQPYLGSVRVATAGFAATLVAVIVPFTLGLLDEWYLLKAGQKARRALLGARRSERQSAIGARPSQHYSSTLESHASKAR